MARPLRRVVINIACKLGIDFRVIQDTWDMEDLQHHMVVLTAMHSPAKEPQRAQPKSEEELADMVRARLNFQ